MAAHSRTRRGGGRVTELKQTLKSITINQRAEKSALSHEEYPMELINILLGGGILAFIQWAVSELPQHSATLFTSDGRAIMNQCYRHEIVQPEPEVEPTEPEVNPEEG